MAHFYNGTVLDIAKVLATPTYRALMERLGKAPAPASPPGQFARWQRWWNKKRGLPATADVGVLASLLSALKDATKAAVADHHLPSRGRIDHVALTHPSIPALAREDVDDALEYAGLRGWLGDSSGFQPRHIAESQAAFAGNGHGLCPSYEDMSLCWSENEALPRGLGLFVSMTRHALYASVDDLHTAFPRWQSDGPRVMDFDAGLGVLDGLSDSGSGSNGEKRSRFASEAEYWAHVRVRITAIAKQRPQQIPTLPPRERLEPLTLLLLGGENATNGQFLDTLRSVLTWGSLSASPPNMDLAAMANPTFAAARGMALYARRRQEVPGRCMEVPRCFKEREKEREMLQHGSRGSKANDEL